MGHGINEKGRIKMADMIADEDVRALGHLLKSTRFNTD
jgi:hypothetical protein